MPMTAAVEVIVAAESETARAMPKSMTLTWPWGVIITFPGFTSRWTIPLRWLKSRAPQMSAERLIARSGAAGPRRSTSRRSALDVLHDDVRGRAGGGAVLAGVVDRDDGRVVQRRGGLRLAPEPDLEGRVAGEIAAQHLDGDLAAEPQVAAAVHLGHAAAAEDSADLVALTEHLRRVVIEGPLGRCGASSGLAAAASSRAAVADRPTPHAQPRGRGRRQPNSQHGPRFRHRRGQAHPLNPAQPPRCRPPSGGRSTSAAPRVVDASEASWSSEPRWSWRLRRRRGRSGVVVGAARRRRLGQLGLGLLTGVRRGRDSVDRQRGLVGTFSPDSWMPRPRRPPVSVPRATLVDRRLRGIGPRHPRSPAPRVRPAPRRRSARRRRQVDGDHTGGRRRCRRTPGAADVLAVVAGKAPNRNHAPPASRSRTTTAAAMSRPRLRRRRSAVPRPRDPSVVLRRLRGDSGPRDRWAARARRWRHPRRRRRSPGGCCGSKRRAGRRHRTPGCAVSDRIADGRCGGRASGRPSASRPRPRADRPSASAPPSRKRSAGSLARQRSTSSDQRRRHVPPGSSHRRRGGGGRARRDRDLGRPRTAAAGEALVGDDAERVDVGARVTLLPSACSGARYWRCRGPCRCAVSVPASSPPGDAEVGQHQRAVGAGRAGCPA